MVARAKVIASAAGIDIAKVPHFLHKPKSPPPNARLTNIVEPWGGRIRLKGIVERDFSLIRQEQRIALLALRPSNGERSNLDIECIIPRAIQSVPAPTSNAQILHLLHVLEVEVRRINVIEMRRLSVAE